MSSSPEQTTPTTITGLDEATPQDDLIVISSAELAALKTELETLREDKSRLELLLQMSNDHCDVIASDLYEKTLELKHAKEVADAGSRAKSAFLANMSHEFRTPLNGILGFVQILLRDNSLSAKQQDNLKIVQRSGEHLLTLISDVLDLSRIEAGKLVLQESDFNLPALLKEIVELFEMRAMQKGIGFTYEILPPAASVLPLSALQGFPLLVKTDGKRLRQVLLNLLSNAVKFTQKGHVVFRCIYANDYLRFEVEDTGCGIPLSQQDNIFLPFHQLGDVANHVDGTGLGLSITRNLLEMMGSELKMESLPHAGSVFWFTLKLLVVQYVGDSYLVKDKYFKSHHLSSGLAATNSTGLASQLTTAQPLPQYADMPLPAGNTISVLLDLAELGDVKEMLKCLEHLEAEQFECGMFFDEIKQMLHCFEIKKLKEFLRYCLDRQTPE